MTSDVDILMAGGGIAGLTAGLVGARLGRRTLVLTGDQLGGNLLSVEKIEGYPGFPDGVAGSRSRSPAARPRAPGTCSAAAASSR